MVFDINKIKRKTDEINFVLDGDEYTSERLTMEDEAVYASLYYSKDGKTYIPVYAKLLRLCKIYKCPYTRESIEQVIGIKNKTWDCLTISERFNFFNGLESDYITKLLKAYELNSGNEKIQEELKN